MTMAKKIGIILIIVGVCLPTAALPFITEFHPLPDVCLTSNFFKNMGNMEIVIRPAQTTVKNNTQAANYKANLAVPYRYVFALGVVLFCFGIGTLVLSGSNRDKSKH